MLAVLVAAVGAGWWLSASRKLYPQVALDVLADIRKRGLRETWGDEPVTNWYIIRHADGRNVGWRFVKRIRREDGRYLGISIKQSESGGSVESWILDDSASNGKYEGTEYKYILLRGPGKARRIKQATPKTLIVLKNGQVRVERSGAGGLTAGVGQAPANYIPEGLTDMVMFETAARGQKTSFQTLVNRLAIQHEKLRFLPITATAEGKRVVRAKLGKNETLLTFDEAGNLLRQSSPDSPVWFEKSSAEIVTKAFPKAKRYAQAAPASAPASAPTTTPASSPAEDTRPIITTCPSDTVSEDR